MKEPQCEALLLSFVRRLKAAGSWCWEAHIQKSTYFLQEFMHVPLELNYIFYKHGPFSFDLNDRLTALRGNELVELRSQKPYGPHLLTTALADSFIELFPTTIGQYKADIDFVVGKLAAKNVAELDRLSTALYVRLEMPGEDDGARAKRINQLKPQVTIQEAREALREVQGFEQDRIAMMAK